MEDIRNLTIDDDLFDPLADEEDDGAEEQDEDVSVIGDPLNLKEKPEAAVDSRTPRERICDLMKEMPGQKRVILRLIDYCREPKSGPEMDARTEELRAYNYSVYTPVVFRELLEGAGAIAYIVPEGEDASEDGAALCHEGYTCGDEDVELEYREIGEDAPGVWQATEDGLAVVDEQDDFKRAEELLAKEEQYKGIYQRILDYCKEDGGRSAKEIDVLVNNDPLLAEPRRYSGYFVGRLEREGAVEWRDGWVTTEVGTQVLAAME